MLAAASPWKARPLPPFAYSPDGVTERIARAGLRVGDGPHIHPKLNVVVRDEPIAVPGGIGTGPAHAPMHTHDPDGTIHVEGAASGTIGQFLALWGVEFGRDQLGPYHSNGSERVRMWVKARGQPAFKESPPDEDLQLADGQEFYLFFGRPSQAPIA